MTVIRRLDHVLEPTKTPVLEKRGQLATRIENGEPVLSAASGEQRMGPSPTDGHRDVADAIVRTEMGQDPEAIVGAGVSLVSGRSRPLTGRLC